MTIGRSLSRRSLLGVAVAAIPTTRRTEDLAVADPFILAARGTYYLYGVAKGGIDVFRSKDLKVWDGPATVLRSAQQISAPEVHPHRGRFYLVATFRDAEASRLGTQVHSAKSPMGLFRPFKDRLPHTPRTWSALDGTLTFEYDVPYLVFCRDWRQFGDGTVEIVQLKKDLSAMDGPTKTLFHASDGPWVQRTGSSREAGFSAAGPFLHRTQTGKLVMIWTSNGERHSQAMGMAASLWGGPIGPWVQRAEPLIRTGGGQGNLFRTFDGKLKLVLNGPTAGLRLLDVDDSGDWLKMASHE